MSQVQLGVDQRSLDSLRNTARADPQAAVKEAAEQFEALFMRQLLKSMRDSIPKGGFTDSAGERMGREMLDDQLVSGMVGAPGGLGATIARHLSRYMPGGMTPAIAGGTRSPNADGASALSTATPSASLQVSLPSSLTPPQRDASLNAGGGFDMGALPPGIAASLDAGRQALLNSREGRFVASLWPHAQAAQEATGVPAAFVVGQAALESGWGGGEMRHPDGRPAHNLFGIKAGSGWDGETVDVMTHEYIDGQRIRQVERFRAYESYEASFSDWIGLMTRHPRYRDVLRNTGSVEGYAQGMQASGYATDPNYGDKLQRVIERAMQVREDLT